MKDEIIVADAGRTDVITGYLHQAAYPRVWLSFPEDSYLKRLLVQMAE